MTTLETPTMPAQAPADGDLLPEPVVAGWLNTAAPLTLAGLRGRVVVLHAFQMLCPACVSHGLPQMQRLAQAFGPRQVALVGLHSVFEHHEAMSAPALKAFVHEYRLGFPIAIDRPGRTGPLPETLQAWDLRGTPSLLVLDRAGRLRLHHFGTLDDLRLGALLGGLLRETGPAEGAEPADTPGARPGAGCGAGGRCELPEG